MIKTLNRKFINAFNKLESSLGDYLICYGNKINKKIRYSKKLTLLCDGNYPLSSLISENKDYLSKIGYIRNELVHNYYDELQVNEKTINKLAEFILLLQNPKTSLEFFKADIFKCRQSDLLSDIISKMNECKYTHVPVYSEDNIFQGILNESNISNYFCTSLISISNLLKDNMKVGEIDLNHTSELCEFIPGTTLVYEIENKFYNSISENKRLGVLFITQNGHKNEEIKGIITPWDLPRLKDLKFVEE